MAFRSHIHRWKNNLLAAGRREYGYRGKRDKDFAYSVMVANGWRPKKKKRTRPHAARFRPIYTRGHIMRGKRHM